MSEHRRRKQNNIQVFKFAVINASKDWKCRKKCNAFLKDGKVARRCPEYKARARRLNELLEKVTDFRDNDNHFEPAWKEAASFSENPVPKSYLRRNAKKFRMSAPYYNQKRNEYIELGREKPQQVRTKKYTENVQFNFHLESFHGYDAFDLTAEPNALNSMLPSHTESWQRNTMLPPSSSFYQQSRSSSRQQNLPPPSSSSQYCPSRSSSRQQILPPSSRNFPPDRSQAFRPSSSSRLDFTAPKTESHHSQFRPNSRQLMLPPPSSSSLHQQQHQSRSSSRQQNLPPSSSRQHDSSRTNSRQLMLPPPPSSSLHQQSRSSSRQQNLPPPSSNQLNTRQLMLPPSTRNFPADRSQSSRPSSSSRLDLVPARRDFSQFRPNSRQQEPPSRSSSRQQNLPLPSSSSRQNDSSRTNSRYSSHPLLPPPKPVRSSSRQQREQTIKEIVLFDLKSPAPRATRYNGPEISFKSDSKSSARPPLRPINSNSGNSFAEQSSYNQVASILDYDDENALLRSFYTKYHMNQFCVDEDEKDYQSIEELANSDLIEHSITNPPPNGLRLREYTKTDYKKMRLSTKKVLREWKESLAPCIRNDDSESGYEDDGEEPIETWNRLVREMKKKSQKRPYNRRSLNDINKNNNEKMNASFESVQSEPAAPHVTIEETIQRTRKIITTPGVKDLRQIGRRTIIDNSRIVDVPSVKRTATGLDSSSEPSPKKRRRTIMSAKETPKINQIESHLSFRTPSTSRNSTIIKTPSTVDIFHRLQNSGTDGETPIRRSPRALPAICYKI